MCFYSETAGFLPDRVSALQEVVSLHLKVPSSQLLSLQMKSQLTKVQHAVSSEVVLFTVYLYTVRAVIAGVCFCRKKGRCGKSGPVLSPCLR